MVWHMGARTFAEKFEQALTDRREQDPNFGLRTLARILAGGDKAKVETIRRRLHKYRPPKGGGSAEVEPTRPTRWEIEQGLGLERDALAPDPVDAIAARQVFVPIALDYDLLAEAIGRRDRQREAAEVVVP